MRNLVTINSPGLPSTERHERMAQQARASKAERTWRAYGGDWQIWEAWAAANNVTARSADPQRVAEFLWDVTISRKLSTVRRYLTSLSVSHTLRGHIFERKDPAIKSNARGALLPGRVRPLLSRNVRALLRDLEERAAGRRDAALLALDVAPGCRDSELAGLDWAKRGTGSGMIQLPDEGAVVILFSSKTSHGKDAETICLQSGVARAQRQNHWLLVGQVDRPMLAESVVRLGHAVDIQAPHDEVGA